MKRTLEVLLVLAVLGILLSLITGPLGWRAPTRVILYLRLPRILLAITAGASLAVSGCILQAVLRNPLATPYTLGISAGAGVTAGFIILSGVTLPVFLVYLSGTAGALAASTLTWFLAGRGSRDHSSLILAGVTVNLLGASVLLLIEYMSPASRLVEIVRWMMGDLAVAGYRRILFLVPFLVAGMIPALMKTGTLNQFLTGTEVAESRGVNTVRERLFLLVAAAVLAGGAVGAVGPVGFVGLIVPHTVRRLAGGDYRRLLPLSALGGAVLMIWADIFSRVIITPAELPIGVILSLLGGPFFLYLLVKKPML
ncbi:MAG: iron ABC transporter permease [Candidatus Fermentibacteraceae bacterium]|nr:iron ABC transporter permease [Candidatus Fermentibacteraceae bacterium]